MNSRIISSLCFTVGEFDILSESSPVVFFPSKFFNVSTNVPENKHIKVMLKKSLFL